MARKQSAETCLAERVDKIRYNLQRRALAPVGKYFSDIAHIWVRSIEEASVSSRMEYRKLLGTACHERHPKLCRQQQQVQPESRLPISPMLPRVMSKSSAVGGARVRGTGVAAEVTKSFSLSPAQDHCFPQVEFLLLLAGCSWGHILHWKLSFVLGSRPTMDALRLANSAFAVDLFKQLCEKEPVGNILFSPICLSTSLSLAQVGAKGDTANEIGQVLHFENVKDVPFGFQTVTSDVNKLSSFYSLKLIKRLYVDKSLNPSTEFISSTKRPYAKELETVDFKDKLEETKGHFENILSENSICDQTKILVVNAAYFVGKWMKKFPESETRECPFRVNKNKHLSMLIVLPKDVEDESTGLEKIEKQLNPDTLLQWTNPSTMANAKVKLSLPKFKVEKIIDPKASLESLGLKSLFNENTSDFSGMSETKGVALSNMIHRVCLEITEDGGESIEVPGSRILQHKDEFNADHPFIYIIRHNKTRNIIFFGKFCSP
ncbi:hypothetical protein A6R68_05314 [Neotoma lepida]|uniref:Serpin domain-containing protein n=1 Tax=Neotoma lepida TaxID=56216 RepID=A0A1A6GIV5_NEOLE|nr:hypothetical protein A6R68_05314 [Neotoma lepida]